MLGATVLWENQHTEQALCWWSKHCVGSCLAGRHHNELKEDLSDPQQLSSWKPGLSAILSTIWGKTEQPKAVNQRVEIKLLKGLKAGPGCSKKKSGKSD